MFKYIFMVVWLLFASGVQAAYDCPTALIDDPGQLLKLKADAQAKLDVLDEKCLSTYQERNREYLKRAAAVENKEGEYKQLSKKERESLLIKMKYEYQASQTQFSKECYGEEAKEYRECLSSISKQMNYLNEQAKLRRENEARKVKEAQAAAASPEQGASAETETDGVLPPQTTETSSSAQVSPAVEVVGMVTTSPDAAGSSGLHDSSSVLNSSSPSSSGSASVSSGNGLFGHLTAKGAEVFRGMREIIFAVAGFGITAVAIGGFFGTVNWKWLTSIIIGLLVISMASSIINYMVDSNVISPDMITDTLISGA